MKKITKIAVSLVLAFSVIATNAFAIGLEDIHTDLERGKIVVKTKGEKNKPASIMVLKPNADVSQNTSGNLTDFAYYADTVYADDNGNLVFEFPIPVTQRAEFSVYKLIVNSDETKSWVEPKFYNADAIKNAVLSFNSLQPSQVMENIELKKDILNLDTDIYRFCIDPANGINTSLITKEVSSNSYTENDILKLQQIILNSEIASILDTSSDSSVVRTYLKKYCTDMIPSGSSMTAVLSDSSFDTKGGFDELTRLLILSADSASVSEFSGKLEKLSALSLLNLSGSFADWNSVVTTYAGIFEIDISKYSTLGISKETVFKSAAANMPYSSVSEFKTAFDYAVANTKQPTGSNTGGVSGGTSGSGNGGGLPISPATPVETPTTENFKDIDGVSWAKDAINKLYDKGIIKGKEEGIFDPDANVLREEYAKMLVVGFNFSADSGNKTFTDVNPGEWYADYIKAAYDRKIVSGISETEFGTGLKITRQDIAVMAYNALRASGKVFDKGNTEKFSDDEKIADYAKEAVYTLSSLKIINGVGDNTFDPTANATRAQAAKIIYEILVLTGGVTK